MAQTWTEYQNFLISDIAPGYITGFHNGAQLGLFDFTATYTSGSDSMTICPQGRVIQSHRVQDGIQFLPGGRVFSPWGLADQKAPVSYPPHTQPFVFRGDINMVMQYYERLLGRVGLTGDLYFSYGRQNSVPTWGVKYCEAMLLNVSGQQEMPFNTALMPRKTMIRLTCTWQQTGAFRTA